MLHKVFWADWMETLVAVSAESRIEIKKNQLTWIYFYFKYVMKQF